MRKIILGLLITSSVYASDWDVEYWQYFQNTQFKCGAFRAYLSGLVRLDKDITRFYYYRITQNVSFRPLCWLDLEAHYSFIYSKPRGASSFNTTSRLELEVIPIFEFARVTVEWRNRLEIIKRQHISDLRYTLRERLMFKIPVCLCPLVSINFYDELFYNFEQKQVTENRFTPIEFSLSFCRINLDLFFMLRNFKQDKWYNSFVFGTQLAF
ncbi:MAG: DUF2490 domain-containing protein [Verrucomicrobia bacterium]|nr:DUF2490 domain-containing protein [Verrucomicrobiota bacterium]